jgi:dienelactone hydrolase
VLLELQAALGLVFGLIALFIGAVAIHHLVAVGGNGADWLGILFLAIGVSLLAGTVRALLRRPRVSRRWRRWTRVALTALAVPILLLFVVVPIGGAVWLTQKPRDPVHPRPLAAPHENVTLETSDGIALKGWYLPSRNGAAIVLVHGAGGNRDGVRRHALMLHRHGYGVLLYDERGRGESGGRTQGMGWTWQPDVTAAVDYLASRPDVRSGRIGGLGLSTGAEVLLEAAAGDDRLHAVVADGAIARSLAETELLSGSQKIQAVPYFGLMFATMRVLAAGSPPPSLKELVPRIAPRPTLLVATGTGSEQELSRIYAEAGGPTARLWELPDVAHTHGLRERPAAYEARITRFFDTALVDRSASG